MVKQRCCAVEAWRVGVTLGSVYEGQASGGGMRSDVFITIPDVTVMAHV
jgi:hypothetical protein